MNGDHLLPKEMNPTVLSREEMHESGWAREAIDLEAERQRRA